MGQETSESQQDAQPPQTPLPLPPPYPYYYPQSNQKEIKILDIWKFLVKNKLLISLITVISTTIAVVVALLSTPIYRAETLLVPVNKDGKGGGMSALAGQFGGLASMAGINFGGGGGSDTITAIATLKSRTFTEQFIRDYKLLPILFEDEGEITEQNKAVNDSGKAPTMWDAHKVFNTIRNISEDKKTGLITLSIEWKDPKQAANWANELVTRINMRFRADALKESERNLKFLHEQINKTSVVDIQTALFGLIESEMKKAMLANVSDEYAFNIIDVAVEPEERIKPKRRVIVMLGFVIGVFLGIFSGFLRHLVSLQRD